MMADQTYEVSNGDQTYAQDGGETYDQSGYEQVAQAGGETAGTEGNAGEGDRINASKNDDDERKLFVGGLSWETTVKDLREYFTKFGDVSDCTLKTDPTTRRSRGFGFVLFADSSSVEKVVAEKSHMLHGRNIDPKRAKARGGREPIKKVFIGGLDPEFPEKELRDYFSTFGKIEEIDLPYDKQKQQRRAFCFITFESEEIVDKVCEQPKQKLGLKEVDVKKATPKDQNARGGGRGGFGGGYGDYNQGWGNQGGYNQGYGGNNYYQGGYGGYGGYYGGGYGGGYGGYDYNQGWGGYDQSGYSGYGSGYGGDYNQGYGGYDYSGWGFGQDNSQGGQQNAGGYKAKRGGAAGAGGHGYHPYSR